MIGEHDFGLSQLLKDISVHSENIVEEESEGFKLG